MNASAHRREPMSRAFAVVPAAGRSARMGRPKLLLSWQGATVLEAVLAAWQASRVDRVVAVVHPDDAEVEAVCRRAGATVVVPRVPPPDMKASVACGLEYLKRQEAPTEADVWLAAPADLPLLSPGVINAVLAAHDPADPRVIVPAERGRRGHPVLFPWALASDVEELGPDEGLNRLVDCSDCRVIEVPGAAPEDLDTPEDYRRLSGE